VLGLPSPVKNGNSKINLLQVTGIGCLKGGTKPKKVHPNHIEISKVYSWLGTRRPLD
jgi:hypothetical protein